jgi:hypothetical protein
VDEIGAHLTGASKASEKIGALLYPELADLKTEKQILERFDFPVGSTRSRWPITSSAC